MLSDMSGTSPQSFPDEMEADSDQSDVHTTSKKFFGNFPPEYLTKLHTKERRHKARY